MAVDLHIRADAMPISAEDRAFFTALGVTQQTLQSDEVGRRRIPVSALPVVASTLAVSLDALFGSEQKAHRSGKREPAPQWQQQMAAIAQRPKARQRFVTEMLQTVLAQAASR